MLHIKKMDAQDVKKYKFFGKNAQYENNQEERGVGKASSRLFLVEVRLKFPRGESRLIVPSGNQTKEFIILGQGCPRPYRRTPRWLSISLVWKCRCC